MKITNMQLKILNSSTDSSLLGIATLQLDEQLIIHDVKLIQLKSGKRIISFPNKKMKRYIVTKDSNNNEIYEERYEYTDIIHPSNSEFRQYLEEEIFKIYDSEVGKETVNE